MCFKVYRTIRFVALLLFSTCLVACSPEEEAVEISENEQSEISQLDEGVSEDSVSEDEDSASESDIEYRLNQTGLPEFLKAIEANAEVQASYKACPGKIFQKYNSYKDHLSINDDYSEQCASDPATCLKQCIQDRNGVVCQDLAYVLEDNQTEITPRYGRMMYAQACATGWPLSCTNRGAGIRNSPLEDDPFFKKDEAETNICLNASFEKMCDEQDAWGCYMAASSFNYGEGRDVNEAKAEEFYKLACDIDEESSACIY